MKHRAGKAVSYQSDADRAHPRSIARLSRACKAPRMINSGLPLNRREMLLGSTAAAMAGGAASAQPVSLVPTWQSLAATYRVPEWFRDAKFGIWAHWGPQCQPEHGDWYARFMYLEARSPWMQGETDYQHHLQALRPSQPHRVPRRHRPVEGREWQPEYLLRALPRGGCSILLRNGLSSRQFRPVRQQPSRLEQPRVGPKRDIVGTWAPLVARRAEVRRLEPFEPCLALVPGRLRL